MEPDAIVQVRFKTFAEGGRRGHVTGEMYGAPMLVDGMAFECRLLIEGQVLELGETYEVPVKFMNPASVLPRLAPGKAIGIWEGREVATGMVVRLLR